MGDFLAGGRELTDLYLQVRINGDMALLKGIMKALLENETEKPGSVLDKAFIEDKTFDFESFAADLKEASWAQITEESGLLEKDIREAAQIYQEADGVIICWAMGLTQHVNGVANIQSCLNLLLMGGNIGKPGAGACPVRGHSNVQGDRTMGIWEAPPESFLDKLGEVFDFEPPRGHGLAVVPAIKAMHDETVKVFIGMGGNFISATPDTEYTAEALRKCDLTVQVSTKLNRSHLITGKKALILPCLGRTEIDKQSSGKQFVTVENSMGVVHRSQGHLLPASSHLLSEPAIVAAMAQAVLPKNMGPDWSTLSKDYDLIRNLIEKTIPGFEDFNQRVKTPHGFSLPNGPREGNFPTPTGKAQFTVHPIPKHDIPGDHFMMMTIRSHDQYNTTIYGLDDRYRGILQVRRVILMNVDDMAEHKLQSEDIVNIHNTFGGRHRVAQAFKVVPYDIPRGCVATYFPEANVLVPIDKFAKKSLTPASKSIVVKLEKTSSS
jgi:molybdopterin-dependent oxidoreductase alpha subunit